MEREQIIKALELHSQGAVACLHECPYGNLHNCGSAMARDTLSLIKELTEENERLKTQVDMWTSTAYCEKDRINSIKADTVRKMQTEINKTLSALCKGDVSEIRRMIDQIAKEMLEDTNES